MNELSKPAGVPAAEQTAKPAHGIVLGPPRDTSPEAVAARMAAFDRFVRELAAMPILDPRPVQEIIDDLNDI